MPGLGPWAIRPDFGAITQHDQALRAFETHPHPARVWLQVEPARLSLAPSAGSWEPRWWRRRLPPVSLVARVRNRGSAAPPLTQSPSPVAVTPATTVAATAVLIFVQYMACKSPSESAIDEAEDAPAIERALI